MLLLAVDTSDKQGSIALARCGPGDVCEVIECASLSGGTFSAQLVPEIAILLGKHGFRKSDLDAFVVVSGPGSFTGLRVGLAAIKALAEILAKPIAAVSMLEVLASGNQGKVAAVLDAGRKQVFVGEYDVSGGRTKMTREYLISSDRWSESPVDALIVTPDKTVADTMRQKRLDLLEVERPRADAVVRLGYRKICSGETVSPDVLEAMYIGQSDSEMFVKSKS